jgi:hypothetical protein
VTKEIVETRILRFSGRLAALKEAKTVAAQHRKYLTENSPIKSVSDPEILPPEPKEKSA